MRSSSRLTSSRCAAGTSSHLLMPSDQRAAGLEDEPGQVRVLLGHALARVEQQDHDVGVLDRLQRLHDRELLDRLEHLAAPADARGVDQRVATLVALEVEVDRVARRARLVEGDDALLAEQRVDQRRLADVGAADDRDLDPAVGVALLVAAPRRRAPATARARSPPARCRRAPTRSDAARPAPARRNRRPRARSRAPRPCSPPAPPGVRSGAAGRRSSCPAATGPARASVRKITASASAMAWRVCFAISCRMPSLATGSKPPVSTTRNGRSPHAAAAVVAVARQPREVGDQRGPGLGQPVEQRRLADVGAADEDEGGQHGSGAGDRGADRRRGRG